MTTLYRATLETRNFDFGFHFVTLPAKAVAYSVRLRPAERV